MKKGSFPLHLQSARCAFIPVDRLSPAGQLALRLLLPPPSSVWVWLICCFHCQAISSPAEEQLVTPLTGNSSLCKAAVASSLFTHAIGQGSVASRVAHSPPQSHGSRREACRAHHTVRWKWKDFLYYGFGSNSSCVKTWSPVDGAVLRGYTTFRWEGLSTASQPSHSCDLFIPFLMLWQPPNQKKAIPIATS